MDLLGGLNDAQKEAVLHTDGPLLILAGAGSGKTKTLTHRIAHLITAGVYPSQILAVTFTNKAAREMRERLAKLLNTENSRDFMTWMGTFHGICVKLLRIDGDKIGIPKNYVIYDEDDRQGLIKQIIRELRLERDIKPQVASSQISTNKNQMITAAELAASAVYPFQKNIAEIYKRYESAKHRAGALDFDDLLIQTVRLMRESKETRQKWQDHFHYILIDEYQDTNTVQYNLIKLLVNSSKNLAVVGDDWQSIYSWRGADYTNILNFERDYTGAKVVKLEQNYRSTGNILTAAQTVISKNSNRTDKKLWTAEGDGQPVEVHPVYDEVAEARFVAERIALQTNMRARSFADFAVLYRTNAQSQPLEKALLTYKIPYKIVGGVRFYDRKEIKDIVAYLRLIYQPSDRMSFSRIANVPARGVGQVSLEKFFEFQAGRDIISTLTDIDSSTITGKAKLALLNLGKNLADVRSRLSELSPSAVVKEILEFTRYIDYLNSSDDLTAEDRIENVGQLVSDAENYATLEDFLAEVALVSSSDETADEAVTLMTLHSAKGLEFPVVFMIGLEEGLLPHSRVFNGDAEDLEEERRLCYVGMTRARQELHISYAYSRLQFGARDYKPVSRFIADMGSSVAIMTTQPDQVNGFKVRLPENSGETHYEQDPDFQGFADF